MKNHRLKVMALSVMLASGVLYATAQATAQDAPAEGAPQPVVNRHSVDDVLKAGADKAAAAKEAQKRIDKIAEQTYDLLGEFKTVNKQIEGLRIYNAQLDRQIQNQVQAMADLQESIEDATVMERQIIPLTTKMLDGLEQFVALDMPFNIDSRKEAIQNIRNNMDSSRYSSAEKFRQVLELYDIEGQYSRTIDQYDGLVEIDGQERQVTFFRVGRIALLYQTPDQDVTGAWNKRSGQWENADDFRGAVNKGIKIAKKQAAIDILTLPILAPEAGQ